MNLNFNPFPILHSERLFLRQIRESDVQEVFKLRSDAESKKHIYRPLAKTQQYAVDHINEVNKGIDNNKSISWAITLNNEDHLIGLIGFVRIQPKNFRAEVGYTLHPDFRREGIMSEALKLILDYGFNTLGFNSIMAVIDPSNHPSEQLLIKHKFNKEAYLRENIFFNGQFLDTVIYSLLSKNYKRS